MELGRLPVTGLGVMLLVTAEPLVGVRWIDTGGIVSARVHETFREPPVWRSDGGVLRRDLEMQRTATKLGHRKLLTPTYEGRIPGPTWRLKPGDRIQVRLINNMTPSVSAPLSASVPLRHDHGGLDGELEMETPPSLFTNMHVHGLQVDPRGNGDNVFIQIPPGQYFDFDIPIPANQPSGLFFYHPHRHRSVTGSSGTAWGEPSSSKAGSIPCRRSRPQRIGSCT